MHTTGGVIDASDVIVASLIRYQDTVDETGTAVVEVMTDVAHSSTNPVRTGSRSRRRRPKLGGRGFCQCSACTLGVRVEHGTYRPLAS